VAVERVFPGATSSAAIGRGLVASSFQYYLTGDEQLRVTVTTLQGARDYDITYRFWRESDRQIQVARQRLSTTDPGPSTATATYPLDSGALLNLRVGRTGLNVFYGLTWVQVQIVRGDGAAQIVLGTLLQGFVSNQNDLGWPGSPIEKQDQASGFIQSVGAIITGASATWTVPVGERWRVICGRFAYTAGAVAGTRFPFLQVNDAGVNQVFVDCAEWSFGAGQQAFIGFAPGVTRSSAIGSAVASLCFPADLEIRGGDTVTATTVGAQVGDAVSGATLAVRTRVDG
jgi:hypothetical protein